MVDDDRDSRFVLCGILSWAGFSVDEAGNGLEALRFLEHRRYAAVVADDRMPVMDGLELLKAVQVIWPETAVILVSGTAAGVTAEARRVGAAACLSKPFDAAQLIGMIDHATERVRQREGTRAPVSESPPSRLV